MQTRNKSRSTRETKQEAHAKQHKNHTRIKTRNKTKSTRETTQEAHEKQNKKHTGNKTRITR